MEIKHTTKKAYTLLLDLIFPVLCIECGLDGSYLCAKCELRISSIPKDQICPSCTKPSPLGKTHPSCSDQFPLNGFIHALRYKDSTVKKLVELFKYHGIKDISQVAGKVMAQEIQNQSLTDYFSDFILVPIPLHPKRLKWRGYNQSELMATEIAKNLNMKIDTSLLSKTKHSTAQAKLNKRERKENLIDAFAVNQSCQGKKILIIDDVATTRSTLIQAASEFKKAQAVEVWALTLGYED